MAYDDDDDDDDTSTTPQSYHGPFMLGSFTNGLFNGARDTFSIVNDWETLKQNRMQTQRQQMMLDAAKQVGQATDAPNSAAQPDLGATAQTSTPYKLDSNGRPDLSSAPLPKFMQGLPLSEADYQPDAVRREPLSSKPAKSKGRGAASDSDQDFRAGQTASPSAGVTPQSGASTASTQQAIPTDRSQTTSALPAPRTAAPNYLPNNVTIASNSPYAAPVAAPQVGGTPLATPAPSSMVVPQLSPTAPSLANNAAFGEQILGKLNPM